MYLPVPSISGTCCRPVGLYEEGWWAEMADTRREYSVYSVMKAATTFAYYLLGCTLRLADVDPDEYLWSKLTGRCCMQLRLECPFPNAPQSMCKNVGPASCNDCKVQRTSQQSGRVMMEAAVPGGTACVGRVRLSERAAPS